MTTPTAIQKMLDWQAANIDHWAYSENSGRLDPEHSGYTDCSGLARWLYLHFANLDIGTYTGNEITHGYLVTQSKGAARDHYLMLPGDLVFYRWSTSSPWTYDHVNFYAGGDLVYNHGGPGRGPIKESLRANVDAAVTVMVRRYIHQTVTPPPAPAPSPTGNPMHGHPVPALIARGTGDYYGLITGPNESHGGAYTSEQPAIKLIQGFLNWKYKLGLRVDGIFGSATASAVTKFQHAYMPGTTYFGQVWYDDWSKMASL